jgi:Asp-tRNA(Asn)/Glu-tRNA(Gln) amidotransferase C subunit
MENQVRRLNDEYQFNLSEEEIKLVAKQAEDADRLFKQLYEIDLTDVVPVLKFEKKVTK